MLNLHTHITLCWQQLYNVLSPVWQYEFCSLFIFLLKEKSVSEDGSLSSEDEPSACLADLRMGYGRNELRGDD
jgi:hypothetical protein